MRLTVPSGLPMDAALQDQVQESLRELDVIMLTVGGSHSYGTSHAGSDVDMRGVFQTATTNLFRLHKPEQKLDIAEPDIMMFELFRFVQLAVKGTPNVLESLWSPVLFSDERGRILHDSRALFLSRRVGETYGNYALSQIRKAREGTGGSRGAGHFGPNDEARRVKFLSHTLRIMWQGIDVLETGGIHVEVRDREKMWALARAGVDAVERELMVLNGQLQRAMERTSLSELVDEEQVDELLIRLRQHG